MLSVCLEVWFRSVVSGIVEIDYQSFFFLPLEVIISMNNYFCNIVNSFAFVLLIGGLCSLSLSSYTHTVTNTNSHYKACLNGYINCFALPVWVCVFMHANEDDLVL